MLAEVLRQHLPDRGVVVDHQHARRCHEPSIQARNKLFPGGNHLDTRAAYSAVIEMRRKEGATAMIRILSLLFDAIASAQHKRAQARVLTQLDERTLRDIGLEFEANSARERARRIDLRFGTY